MHEVQYQITIAALVIIILVLVIYIVKLIVQRERQSSKDLVRIALNVESRQRQMDFTFEQIKNASLTPQLLSVLALIEDNDMKQIADKLFISKSTVAKHVGKLKERLNLKEENGMTDIRVLYPYSQAAKILRNN